jgi:hypothetical protein
MMGRPALTRPDSAFLDALSDDLTPVRPLKAQATAAALAACVAAGLLAVGFGLGFRADLMAGQPSMMFLIRTGLLVPLALICTATALGFARPGVGTHTGFLGNAWAGALAVAATLPLIAMVRAAAEPAAAARAIMQPSAMLCLAVSLASALVFASVMILHLRRGAPVSLQRAGLLVGLSSGSLGVLIYSLHCPADSIHYIAAWYGLAITLATLAGRLFVPRLIRW